MGAVDKWSEIQGQIDLPVKLTELEKKKFTDVMTTIKGMLDDSLEVILDMDRDEAYRYVQLIVNGIKEADMKFAGGVPAPSEFTTPIAKFESYSKPRLKVKGDRIVLITYPDFDSIFAELSSNQRDKAKRYLDCVKTVFELKEMLENPEVSDKEKAKVDINSVLCCGDDKTCSVDEMIKCITIEDPTVKDEMDMKV